MIAIKEGQDHFYNYRLDRVKNLKQLDEKYSYEYQLRYNKTHSVVRFCTSWATKEEHVLSLIEDMK